MTIARVAAETERLIPDELRLIRCRCCGHVLAIRTPSNKRLRILSECEIDETGRPDLRCPVCDQRRRVPRIDDYGDSAHTGRQY